VAGLPDGNLHASIVGCLLGDFRMLRIKTEDLRLGMFIQSLEGSWFDHSFWKSKFLLDQPDDLRALQNSGVDSVWIDEARSLAPALAHLGGQQPTPRPSLAAEFAAMAETEAPVARPETQRASEPRPRRQATVNEYRCAQQLLADCKAAVGDLFARVGNGDASAVEDSAPVVRGIAESVERNPDALITLTRVRTLDEYTYMHSLAVSALMINLAVPFVKRPARQALRKTVSGKIPIRSLLVRSFRLSCQKPEQVG